MENLKGKKPVYICRCNEVTAEEICKAIADGALTLQGVKVRTEATMGLCQGRTCQRLIKKMLSENTDISKLKESIRPPVRAVKIGELIAEGEVDG